MENLDKLLEMTDAEFGAIAKNGKFKSREEIDSVYKLMDIAKDVYCIWQYEDDMGGGEDEMSYARGGSYARGDRGGNRGGNRGGRSYRGGSYEGYYDGSYDDGMGGSYARGRRYAKRDSMGRYSREGGYSRADGKQEYIEHMRDMMMDAPDEKTRQSIQRMIAEMENQ
jgi:hypothetical protein